MAAPYSPSARPLKRSLSESHSPGPEQNSPAAAAMYTHPLQGLGSTQPSQQHFQQQQQHYQQQSHSSPFTPSSAPHPAAAAMSVPSPAGSNSAATGAAGSAEPPKRKITRKRQVLSCRPCTTRKIRCARNAGPGAPCQSCEKRGEAALCDVGAAPTTATGGAGGGAPSTPSASADSASQFQQPPHYHFGNGNGPGGYDNRAVSPGSMLPALPPSMTASPGPYGYGQVLPPVHSLKEASPHSIYGDAGCADHRADLERRIAALESALLQPPSTAPSQQHTIPAIAAAILPPSASLPRPQQPQPGSAVSQCATHGENGARPAASRTESRKRRREAIREGLAWPDGPDSETEDAALTLEDIAVNVRIAGTQMQRRAASISTPVLASSTAVPSADGTPTLGSASASGGGARANMSREKASLLVPEISRRYRGVLVDLYEALPSRDRMDWLIRHYISNVSWYWCAHHLPTLAAEYDAFCELVSEGRQLEIDPLWLAVLFLTLALSANSLDEIPADAPLRPEDLVSFVPDHFEAARAALDCGDAFGSARIRTIQAIALLGPLALNSGDQGRVDILIPYVAGALRLCQQLKLDKLGKDDPAVMPPEDPALPGGVNTLRRECALRLFYALLHLDQVIFRLRPVLPSQTVCSALPGNYDDKDLSADAIVPPPPLRVRSFAQYETLRFRVGAIQRRLHEAALSDDGSFYEVMKRCDAEVRTLLAEYELDRGDGDSTTPLYWARTAALQNIHIRLIRFHRPFVSRGYRDPTYRESTEAALASARVVLETQKELDKTNAPLVKDCYQLNHIQVSIVVLFCEIYQQYDPAAALQGTVSTGGGEADGSARYDPGPDYHLVKDASVCFHRALGSIRERVRAVARQSLLVLQYLFEALHALKPDEPKEAFGHLLKRISVAVTESERAAAGLTSDGAKAEEAGIRSAITTTTAQNGDVASPPLAFGLAAPPSTSNGFAVPNGAGPAYVEMHGSPTSKASGGSVEQARANGVGAEGMDGSAFDAQALAASGEPSHDVHFGELTFDWGYD